MPAIASVVVNSVIRLTFGVLSSTVRNEIAKRLEDGDITDEECRNVIVTQLADIKRKLDGLARKDLLSSVCFLQEGVSRLYQSILQISSEEGRADTIDGANLVEAASPTRLATDSPITLVRAISSLKILSNNRYMSSIESFKLARSKATEAFCNEALSIEDRIQASQIRIVARILESLDDPDASVNDCLQYLVQLHDTRAVQEMFHTAIMGGLKSLFNSTTRLNNAFSVRKTHLVLFYFARRFTKSHLTSDWPMVLVGKTNYCLVFGESRLSIEDASVHMRRFLSPCPDFTYFAKVTPYYPPHSVVTSEGNIVVRTSSTLNIIKRSGETNKFCDIPKEKKASERYVCAIGIDEEDNIYVITGFRKSSNTKLNFKLCVFDANGNMQHEVILPFHQSSSRPLVRIAINKNGKIAILDYRKKVLYIGTVTSSLDMSCYKVMKVIYLRDFSAFVFTSYCNFLYTDLKNETKIILPDTNSISIYTENGNLQRNIQIPKGPGYGSSTQIMSIAINHLTKCILIKTIQFFCHDLWSISENGTLKDKLCLGQKPWIQNTVLTSHAKGPVTLVGITGAISLQV